MLEGRAGIESEKGIKDRKMEKRGTTEYRWSGWPQCVFQRPSIDAPRGAVCDLAREYYIMELLHEISLYV